MLNPLRAFDYNDYENEEAERVFLKIGWVRLDSWFIRKNTAPPSTTNFYHACLNTGRWTHMTKTEDGEHTCYTCRKKVPEKILLIQKLLALA